MGKETSITAELINKEDLIHYKIIKAQEDQSTMLRQELNGALRLGNEFKAKSTIVFQTTEGPKRVETTVWTLTDGYLQIKSGMVIPLNSLIDVTY
jgi:hypothetical protein